MSLLEKIESVVCQRIGFDTKKHNSFRNPAFLLAAFCSILALFLAYSNHFTNSFQFDDTHTIQDNQAIRQVTIGRFFSDGSTFSSLPSNQSYRPYITTENAIDFSFSGKNPLAFHIHIFLTFLLCCALLCIFVKKMLDAINFSSHNQFWGLLVAAVFGLLCANAETVNYIIQRAEIVSALYILAGFVAFLHGGIWRSRWLYLIFPFIGFFAKEMTFVFSPLLFLYVLIMEENTDLLHFYRTEEFKKCLRSFRKILPSFLLTAVFLVFYSKMLPETFSSGGYSRYQYMITQPFVMCHYILTYFVPYGLSADSDWVVFNSLSNFKALTGVIIVIGLLYLALKTSKKSETRLFSFGLLWFFISLLPTSSVIPFSEVLNDHRCFIPYIGLTISFLFGSRCLLLKYFGNALKSDGFKNLIAAVMTIFLAANAYGISQRNKVWKDELSLWKDVAEKSPNNGRGLMNYGLALMARGDFAAAEANFTRAAVLNPDYSIVFVNLGVLKNAQGDYSAAEGFYKKSLQCSTANHSSYYFYAKFLHESGRVDEAIAHLLKSISLAPSYPDAQALLYLIYHQKDDWNALSNLTKQVLESDPNNAEAKRYAAIAAAKKPYLSVMVEDAEANPTAEKYLAISLNYFRLQQFEKCIWAAEKAIALKSDYAEAYNNIGIARVNLKQYELGIEAYNKALSINPKLQLAKNNLQQALLLQKGGRPQLTADDYINQSVEFYNKGEFLKCIEASRNSIAIAPSSAAYNNICSAYNQLKQYDKAIEACDLALKLDPSNQLANGNRQFSLSQKAKK